MKIRSLVLVFFALFSSYAFSWEAKVTNILQHGAYVAVTLSPDPGPYSCQAGSPYLIKVDESSASKQLFSMVLSALATGKSIGGYEDACVNAIWGLTRPSIVRLNLKNN